MFQPESKLVAGDSALSAMMTLYRKSTDDDWQPLGPFEVITVWDFCCYYVGRSFVLHGTFVVTARDFRFVPARLHGTFVLLHV